jgi:hypothetical protein
VGHAFFESYEEEGEGGFGWAKVFDLKESQKLYRFCLCHAF